MFYDVLMQKRASHNADDTKRDPHARLRLAGGVVGALSGGLLGGRIADKLNVRGRAKRGLMYAGTSAAGGALGALAAPRTPFATKEHAASRGASRDRQPTAPDKVLEEFLAEHRNVYGSPTENYAHYLNAVSKMSPPDRKRFDDMYMTRHGYVPSIRQVREDERELALLTRLSGNSD